MSNFTTSGLLSNYSTERIQHQVNDPFIISAEKILTKVQNELKASVAVNVKLSKLIDPSIHKHIKELNALIAKRFGVNIDIIIAKPHSEKFSIIPIYAYTDNTLAVLSTEFLRALAEDDNPNETISKFLNNTTVITKHLLKSEIVIDLKNAVIKKVPSDIRAMMTIDMAALIDGPYRRAFTVRGMLATIVHEIGHVFTYLEYANTVYMVNRTLLDASAAHINKKPIDKYKYRIENSIPDNWDKEELKEINKSEDIAIWGINIVAYSNAALTRIIDTWSEHTVSERLADQFAARFGLGLDLVISLDAPKVSYRLVYGAVAIISSVFTIIRTVLVVSMFIYAAAAVIISVGVVGLLPVVLIALGFTTIYTLLGVSNNLELDPIHSFDEHRYQAVKRELISMLKEVKLSKSNRTALLDNIRQIDVIVTDAKKISKASTASIDNFYNVLNPQARSLDARRELDILLEDMANNDLLVRYYELTALTR